MGRPRLGRHSRTTPLAAVWVSMLHRCNSPINSRYANYGGRGVTVCAEWTNDFDSFADWALSNGWKQGLQIDKDILCKKLGINPPIYSPTTCSIVTRKKNIYNSSSLKKTDKEIAAIVKFFDSAPDTFKHRDILCKKFDITKKQLGCWLAKRGGKKLGRGTSGVISEDMGNTILNMKAEGITLKMIAIKLGIKYNTCKNWHGKYYRNLNKGIN